MTTRIQTTLAARIGRQSRAVSALDTASSPSIAFSTLASLQLQINSSSSLSSSKRCFSAASSSSAQPDIKLYQYHICPFCNITKSLLSYTKLEYEAVEVNPLTKAELKPWSGDYKKVPIALIDETQVNGSDEINTAILKSSYVQDILAKRWTDEDEELSGGMTLQQFQLSDNAQTWFAFARDDLAALLYPNICGTLGDSYDAFDYVKSVDSFSGMQKVSIQSLGALAMYFAASKVKCEYVL